MKIYFLCLYFGLVLFVCGMPEHSLASSKSIRDHITNQIDSLSNFGAHELTIDARRGVVTLSGTVSSENAKQDLLDIVKSTKGVTQIIESVLVTGQGEVKAMPVLPMPKPILSDEIITQNILSAFRANPEVSLEHLEITTKNGIVKFKGAYSSSHRDIDRILGIALMVDGVKDIQSEMRITK